MSQSTDGMDISTYHTVSAARPGEVEVRQQMQSFRPPSMDIDSGPTLLNVPGEIFNHVLSFCDTPSVRELNVTCKALHARVCGELDGRRDGEMLTTLRFHSPDFDQLQIDAGFRDGVFKWTRPGQILTWLLDSSEYAKLTKSLIVDLRDHELRTDLPQHHHFNTWLSMRRDHDRLLAHYSNTPGFRLFQRVTGILFYQTLFSYQAICCLLPLLVNLRVLDITGASSHLVNSLAWMAARRNRYHPFRLPNLTSLIIRPQSDSISNYISLESFMTLLTCPRLQHLTIYNLDLLYVDIRLNVGLSISTELRNLTLWNTIIDLPDIYVLVRAIPGLRLLVVRSDTCPGARTAGLSGEWYNWPHSIRLEGRIEHHGSHWADSQACRGPYGFARCLRACAAVETDVLRTMEVKAKWANTDRECVKITIPARPHISS